MNLFIYCYGGFGREVAEIARRINRTQKRWTRIAFIDDAFSGQLDNGIEVYQLENALQKFGSDVMEAVIANGEPSVRRKLFNKLESCHVRLTSVIDDTAVVSESAGIEPGLVAFPGCYVSSAAKIGQNVAMISSSLIGHDAILGDHTVVSGHVNIGGGCLIGEECYLGMGVQVKQQTQIGRSTIVGMGSVVFADVPSRVIALGNPCRVIRPNSSERVFIQGK